MGSSTELSERDELRLEEPEAEAVELLPARTEMALANVHVSGVANGNKGTITAFSNNTL
jgi:hypothetical protein